MKRNYGIDLLRCLSMISIIGLHILGNGQIITYRDISSFNSNLSLLFYCIFLCGTNCFALVSGYVCINKKDIDFKILSIWANIFLYNLFIILGLVFFGKFTFNGIEDFRLLFPLANNNIWYFTAYFGLYFMMPFLNSGLKAMKSRNRKLLFLIISIVIISFSFISLKDLFQLDKGYSLIWLIILYVLGGIAKLDSLLEKKKTLNLLIAMIILILGIFSATICIEYFSLKLTGVMRGTTLLLQYTNPLYVAVSFIIFELFSRIDFKSPKFIGALSLITPSIFYVLVIHNHPLIAKIYLNNFSWLLTVNSFVFVLLFFAIVFAVFGFCIVVDLCRAKIFDFFKINTYFSDFSTKIGLFFETTAEKIFDSNERE